MHWPPTLTISVRLSVFFFNFFLFVPLSICVCLLSSHSPSFSSKMCLLFLSFVLNFFLPLCPSVYLCACLSVCLSLVLILHLSLKMYLLFLSFFFTFLTSLFFCLFACVSVCCVFLPAFWCCAHPKAGWNTFFQPFSTFFVHFFNDFTPEINK